MSDERTWTVLELLRWTTQHFAECGIATPRLDAECLLAHALGGDRLGLYLDHDKPVEADERGRFRALVRRRAGERVPVAQLVGRREFWSLSLRVTRDVLVPRPETETLVEVALEQLDRLGDREAECRILDVGTGSGAVALALASECPKARITASDVSEAALEVARSNAEQLGLGARLRWLRGSLFEPVEGEEFELVVSNPPYVRSGETLPPELAHEPAVALFGGARGDELVRALIEQAPGQLAPGGALALEIDPGQAAEAVAWCAAAGLEGATVRADLAGRPRVVSARAPRGEGGS